MYGHRNELRPSFCNIENQSNAVNSAMEDLEGSAALPSLSLSECAIYTLKIAGDLNICPG